VTQCLGAAGLVVHATAFPHELPLPTLEDLAALVVDLDVEPDRPAAEVVARAASSYPGVPVLAVAGVDARRRLIDALCDGRVSHALPKSGSLLLPAGGLLVHKSPVESAVGGPVPQDLFAAVRRLVEGPERPGVAPYLLAGAPVQSRTLSSSRDKNVAVEEVVRFAERMGLGEERTRAVELVTEELLMNALFDAPTGPDGRPLFASRPRTEEVRLDDHPVTLRYGCDGQSLAIAVADPFGSLVREAVLERLRAARDGAHRPRGGAGGAGLGLLMTCAAANQLIFAFAPHRFTEVTAVLHVGGSNRAAQERGLAVHFYEQVTGTQRA
jgi:hypothetical protein